MLATSADEALNTGVAVGTGAALANELIQAFDLVDAGWRDMVARVFGKSRQPV